MLARDQEFVKYVVRLVKIENEVKLTNIAEVSVQDLDELVDDLKGDQLVVLLVDTRDEV